MAVRILPPSVVLVNRLKEEVRTGKKTIEQAGVDLGLSDKQIQFAITFTSGQTARLKGKTAELVYPEKTPDQIRMIATRHSSNPVVKALISIIYVAQGLTDIAVDTALMELIFSPHTQDIARVMALKLFYEMTGRSKGQQVNIQVNKYDFSKLSYEQMTKLEEMLKLAEPNDRTEDRTQQP